MTRERMDKVSIYKEDTITQSINLGSAWVHKNCGVRLIHIPTRIMVECTSSNKEFTNYRKALQSLKYSVGIFHPDYQAAIEE